MQKLAEGQTAKKLLHQLLCIANDVRMETVILFRLTYCDCQIQKKNTRHNWLLVDNVVSFNCN